MELSTHEIIKRKVAAITDASIETYMNVYTDGARAAAKLASLGFGETTNVKEKMLKGLTSETIERAKIYDFFGREVLTRKEIKSLCTQFKLEFLPAARFMDTIPQENVKELLDFVHECREKKHNFGTLDKEGYHMPLTTQFMVIAPNELFRKALKVSEMSETEYKKWLKDDPIILKQVYKFNGGDPSTGFNKERGNESTDFFAVITAWGLEATLLKSASGAN